MKRGKAQVLFAAAVLLLAGPASAVEPWSPTFVRRAPRPPTARELAARAHRAVLDVSLSRFLVVHRNATREHPVTGEIELARQDLLRAQQDIDLEIADARAELGRNDDYRKLAAADGALLDKITAEKDPKKRTALATERLALRAKLSSAEKTALAENPRVHAARVAAIEAGQKLERLELDRRVFLLQEPEFVAARTELVTARSALIR